MALASNTAFTTTTTAKTIEDQLRATVPNMGFVAFPLLSHDSNWVLIENGFTLAREHEIESLFATSNGYLGTRASLEEGSPLSSPASYVAGVFDSYGQDAPVPELAIVPDWTLFRVWVAGEALSLESGKILSHQRVLDLRHGLLFREWRQADRNGRITRVFTLRFISLADRHLMFQLVDIAAENYNAEILAETRVELPRPRFAPAQSPLQPRPTDAVSVPPAISSLSLRTLGTNIEVWIAVASELRSSADQRPDGTAIRRDTVVDDDSVVETFRIPAEIGKVYQLKRLVQMNTSRDDPQPDWNPSRHLQQRVTSGTDMVLSEHLSAWESRWQTADIEIEGDPFAQQALRFAIYHLISAANPDDEHVSVGARALTGPAYKGHVFWETEIYMLPFYTHTHPPTARSLLMYRYHTLQAAREKAHMHNCRGAFYAWESADTGAETTPELVLGLDGKPIHVLNGRQELHISADVAYAVWQYWRATGDDDFLVQAGAEIILETARFWASRGQLEGDQRYHIRHVIGPDEYHEDVDDNAYTNLMAQWNLECGTKVASLLQKRRPSQWQDLADRLGLTNGEIRNWAELARVIYSGLSLDGSKHEQFQGFFNLEHIELEALEPRSTPVDVLLGRDRVKSSDLVKQADVVMAVCMLWNRFTSELRMGNFRYYEPRTAHGSSLSPSMHAAAAGRLGDLALAEKYFRQSAEIDLANNMGNATGGVHAGALGGLWQAAVFGIAGVIVHRNRLSLQPHLLPSWQRMRFPFMWRNRLLRFDLQQSVSEVTVEGDSPVQITVGENREAILMPGKRYRSVREQQDWQQWTEV